MLVLIQGFLTRAHIDDSANWSLSLCWNLEHRITQRCGLMVRSNNGAGSCSRGRGLHDKLFLDCWSVPMRCGVLAPFDPSKA
jgi:hypothetical protein